MITPDSAWALVAAHAQALPAEDREILDAPRCYAAEPVKADRDIPPADRSAMDGFAVRSDDVVQTPVELRIEGEVAAGAIPSLSVSSGSCVRIFTGANMPNGSNTVVMQEDTEPVGGDAARIRILKPAPAGANVFKQAENARQGEELISAGDRIDAARIALCAAVGRGRISVHRRPRVALLATGSELLDADDSAMPHQIRDSNGPFLRAALAERRHHVASFERVGDNPAALVTSLRRLSRNADALILTGGVSVGRYDYVADAIKEIGATIRFHGVAMKPGKPQLFATDSDGRMFFGLPGNPLSAMTGFQELVLPALELLAGCPQDRCRVSMTVRTAHDLKTKGERSAYLPARIIWTSSGPTAAPIDARGSADLVAAARADGALIIPANTPSVPAGSFLAFRPWRLNT